MSYPGYNPDPTIYDIPDEAERRRLDEEFERDREAEIAFPNVCPIHLTRYREACGACQAEPNEGCPLCHGDCSSANPPVIDCPMKQS